MLNKSQISCYNFVLKNETFVLNIFVLKIISLRNAILGVELLWCDNQLFVRNHSETTFYLESSLLSLVNSSSVFELCKNEIKQIFNISDFTEELDKAARFGYHRVYDTRQFCSIRIHFQSPLGNGIKLTFKI